VGRPALAWVTRTRALHRVSICRAADRIYVLSDGSIVESGSHEELIAVGGTYAELFTLQATPYR
jgi:ATP-binding cassette subfamily B protein